MKDSISEKIEIIHQMIQEILDEKNNKFIPGETLITTGLAVYDEKEINAMVDSLLKGWFGLSVKGVEFESAFSDYLTTSHTILTNSGSSSNLLALNGVKDLLGIEGGEVITSACTFPTTFNPIIQLGFTPAVIDVDETLNITPSGIENAVNKNTKGIVFAHTMGNPARIEEILEIARDNNLFVIEDCCDALGSKYNNKMCGTFGLASTFSFYPAHGITMGEGGAISTNNAKLKRIITSLRDWGRDCFCRSDQQSPEGECGKRFNYKIGDIFYDHRYIYSRVGYNMKPLELQAAMGIEQLKKIDFFNDTRRRNYNLLKQGLSPFSDYLRLPEINEKSEPIFFGLPLVINDSRIERRDLLNYLNEKKIATRLLFAGNIVKQPAYNNVDIKIYGDLSYTDKIMRDCFWIGIHPGITEEMIQYVVSVFKNYLYAIN